MEAAPRQGGITLDNPMKSRGSFGTFMRILPLDRRAESAAERMDVR